LSPLLCELAASASSLQSEVGAVRNSMGMFRLTSGDATIVEQAAAA